MTDNEALAAAIIRLEGKVETLAEKVRFGDSQSQQLVELLRQQVQHTGAAIDELKRGLAALRHEVLEAVSVVRVDLEKQVSTARGDLSKQVRAVETCVEDLTSRVELLEHADHRRQWRAAALKPLAALAWGTAGTGLGIGLTRLLT